ncbi:MAG: tyrosine-type recombinase/integrase [Acidimicrobiales bacterium]
MPTPERRVRRPAGGTDRLPESQLGRGGAGDPDRPRSDCLRSPEVRRRLPDHQPSGGVGGSAGRHLADRGLGAADSRGLVFVSPRGEVIHYGHWRRRVWLPARRAAGVEGLAFHDLRRANTTALVTAGVDLKTAQVRLGHSDSRLTLAVYAQATTEGDRRAAEGGRRPPDGSVRCRQRPQAAGRTL